MSQDFSSVTELGGESVSKAQLERLTQRYYWAGKFCRDKDVIEVACGAGQGLGYLATRARSLRAGDITPTLVDRARAHYGSRIDISEMNAQQLPIESASLDVVILFEAVYYLPAADQFMDECRRVLRPGGSLLLATANRDLFAFNPSPFSVHYYNPPELAALLSARGFDTCFYGGSPVETMSSKGRLVQLLKKVAVTLNIIPGSMRGKRWLKRLVFGKLVSMPAELDERSAQYVAPIAIDGTRADTIHQVLYCVATLKVPS